MSIINCKVVTVRNNTININFIVLFLNSLPEKSSALPLATSHLVFPVLWMNRNSRFFFDCQILEADMKQRAEHLLLGTKSGAKRAGDLQSGAPLSEVEADQISLVAWPFCRGCMSATEPNKCQHEFK